MALGNWTGIDRDHDSWEPRASEQRPLGDREGIAPKRACPCCHFPGHCPNNKAHQSHHWENGRITWFCDGSERDV